MDVLKVSVLQPAIQWHEPELNLQHFQKLIEGITHTDVLLLPEMWLSGFTMKAHQFYKNADSGIAAMKKWSSNLSAIVIGSLVTKEGDHYFNRSYIIADGKIMETYDKRHLFSFSGEDRYFEPGHNKCIIDYKSWRFCVNTCYDLRFPVWSRNTEDYDVLIYGANWPDKRIDAWNTLLKARAIENQAFVLGANCIGKDAWHNVYNGHSAIISYDGSILDSAVGEETILSMELRKEDLMNYRNTFPFLNERDNFQLSV